MGILRKYFLQIYCWEGVHSIKVDRDAALTTACHLSEETNAQLVKVSQGREPPHLLQIYDGKLKILAGRHRDSRKVTILVKLLFKPKFKNYCLN